VQFTAAQAEAVANAFTFAKLAERYGAEYADRNTKPRTASETRRLLKRAGEFFGDKRVRDIRKSDVIELISIRKANHVHTQGLVEANNLLSAIRRCFRWAVDHDLVETDPTSGVMKPLRKVEGRDHFLSDDEIVMFWNATSQLGWPFGPLLRLLLLTAQREGEVAGLRWSELDLEKRVWNLPRTRTKNGKAHIVHLSDLAREIINGLPRFARAEGQPDFLFSVTGNDAVSGFGYAKERLDKLMAGAEHWRIHDLRRTATTGMARLGIPPHVADRVLNHRSGTLSQVALVYNRFEYLPERKAALEAWGRFVEQLVRPETSNVVALASR
jgi:integrase